MSLIFLGHLAALSVKNKLRNHLDRPGYQKSGALSAWVPRNPSILRNGFLEPINIDKTDKLIL